MRLLPVAVPTVLLSTASLLVVDYTLIGRPADRPSVASASASAPQPSILLKGASGKDPRPGQSRVEPEPEGDLCAVADRNIDRDLKAILALGAEPLAAPAATFLGRWDQQTGPHYLDRILGRFALTAPERAALYKNGFLVLARLDHPTYADAFHDVFQSQLPVYISMDALTYAVYVGSDALFDRLEHDALTPTLERVLVALRRGLPGLASTYPDAIARDLDIYLTVGLSLLVDRAEESLYGAATATLFDKARAANGSESIDLFGRKRLVDFSAYRPRGLGTRAPSYFRASTWLSRLPFEFRSTEGLGREALTALALADLAQRTGALEDLDVLDRLLEKLEGQRSDISLRHLASLREKAQITSLKTEGASERLVAALDREASSRSTTSSAPTEGAVRKFAVTTLLGLRAPADRAAMRPLTSAELPGHNHVGFADIAYLLGHDRALDFLHKDLTLFPHLTPNLKLGRALMHTKEPLPSLRGAWLGVARAFEEKPKGIVPIYMLSDAFADARLTSAMAAYGQLHKSFALLANQSYDEGGCAIPDGFVEPEPAVLDALLAYIEQEKALAASVRSPGDEFDAFYGRVGDILRALRVIVADELTGRPLSTEERRFLAGVAEIVPAETEKPPLYSGWYFRLFRDSARALRDAGFLGDYAASDAAGEITYLGAGPPRLGLFVVDTGGVPRIMVGPVASSFAVSTPRGERLGDEEIGRLIETISPWEAQYTLPPPPEPKLALRVLDEREIALRAESLLGQVTVELLDHHGQPCRVVAVPVSTTAVRARFRPAPGVGPESPCAPRYLRVRVHGNVYTRNHRHFVGGQTFGGAKPLEATDANAPKP